MLVLLQLIKLIGIKELQHEIESMENMDEFFIYLDDCYGIELTNTQMQTLERVITNGSYKAALSISTLKAS